MWLQSLGWEYPLQEEMATHSKILAWKNPMDRGAWWATVHGVAKNWTQLKYFQERDKELIGDSAQNVLHDCALQ